MGIIERLKEVFPRSKIEKQGPEMETAYIRVPSAFYIKELAVYTAVSLVANAISQSEVLVYKKGKRVRDEDYFTLNIKPNPNESSSQFWHKVTERALRDPEGALCFLHNGNIYCADTFTLEQKRPFLGNIYSGVVVDGFQMDRKFMAHEVFHFKLENVQANSFISKMYEEYSAVIGTAMDSYKNTNISKYVLEIEGAKAGDPEFNREFEEILKKPLKDYISGNAQLYVQYAGRNLKQMKSENPQKSSEDTIETIEELFKMAGKAFHIPESLMLGNITNMNDVVKAFLTFAVDPFAAMIGETLTGGYGVDSWKDGNRYTVDTSCVNHIDIFDMAEKIDKLISSSFMCVDEVRERAGLDEIGEEWSRKHMITKNYQLVSQLGWIEGEVMKDEAE